MLRSVVCKFTASIANLSKNNGIIIISGEKKPNNNCSTSTSKWWVFYIRSSRIELILVWASIAQQEEFWPPPWFP